MKVLSIALMAAGVILYLVNTENAFVSWFFTQ
jgi:hypothetical protein